MSKKKTSETVEVSLLDASKLLPGHMVQANDGGFYKVVTVDLVLDPRGGVYEAESNEVIALLDAGDRKFQELIKGSVTIKAA
jgi:hypothetical protein